MKPEDENEIWGQMMGVRVRVAISV